MVLKKRSLASFKSKTSHLKKVHISLSVIIALVGFAVLIQQLQSSAAPAQVAVTSGVPGVPVPITGAYWGGNNGTVQVDPLVQSGCTGDAFAQFECKVDYFASQQDISLPKQSDGKYHASMEHLYMHCSTAESRLAKDGFAWRKASVPGRKVLFINFKCGNWADLGSSNGSSAADAQVKRIAKLIAELPVPVIVSYDAEPEDNSCDPPSGHDSSGTPDDYRAGFRRFVANMREQQVSMGVNRISFAFVMMGVTYDINSSKVFNGSCDGEVRNSSTGSMRNPENWWPGDDVVDWIGTDPYDFVGTTSFDKLVEGTLAFSSRACPAAHPTINYNCTSKRQTLPVLMAEYATCSQNATYRGSWLDNHKAKLSTYPKIKGYAYWSETYNYPCWVDYPFDDPNRSSIKAFARLSSDSYLTSPTFSTVQPGTDTSSPSVSISAPTTGTSATIGSNITITASAYDDVGVTSVDFYRGSTLIGSDASPSYSVSWNTTGLAAGTYTLTARAFDAVGNSTVSTQVNVTLTTTTTSAPISISSPAGNTVLSGVVNYSALFSGSGTIGSVSFRYNETFIELDSDTPYGIQWDTRTVPNGTYTLVVRTNGGTFGYSESAPITVTVNNSTSPKIGDINNDSKVDVFDLSILLSNYNTTLQSSDLNKDGVVNVFDLSMLLSNWNK